MKLIISILIFLYAPKELMAQFSKLYYTGRVYSKFSRELIDESRKSRPVPNPMESINSVHFSIGRKVGKQLRPELGLSFIQQTNQREAFDLVVRHRDIQYTVRLGIVDSIGPKSSYIVSPYFSINRGNGYVINNGNRTDDTTLGLIYGIQLAFHRNVLKKIGIQPVIHLQYERFQNYRGVDGGPELAKAFARIFPSVNLTYNF